MPSIPTIIKVISSIAAAAQPQISEFIRDKKENRELKEENDKLKREINFLKTQRILLIVLSALLCAVLLVTIVICNIR
ncbi:MAG: hypothetical protein FWH43_04155 [Endomicrobia bacterium]|nr:hypothetical protein [Endomicrobiia bacterium]